MYQTQGIFKAIIKLPRRIIPSDRPQALLGLYVKKVLVQVILVELTNW